MSDNKHLEEIINKEYKLGFETLIQSDTFQKRSKRRCNQKL